MVQAAFSYYFDLRHNMSYNKQIVIAKGAVLFQGRH
jgi:hypothetical protein